MLAVQLAETFNPKATLYWIDDPEHYFSLRRLSLKSARKIDVPELYNISDYQPFAASATSD